VSGIIRIIVLLSVFAGAVYVNARYNAWFYRSNILTHFEQQQIINDDINSKIDALQESMDKLQFGMDVNNRIVEDLLIEQIQKKGDE
jgi:hypothetical protein